MYCELRKEIEKKYEMTTELVKDKVQVNYRGYPLLSYSTTWLENSHQYCVERPNKEGLGGYLFRGALLWYIDSLAGDLT